MNEGILDTIRKKPVGTRRIIQFVSSAGLTAVVAFFWWVSTKAIEPEVYVNERVPEAQRAVVVEPEGSLSGFRNEVSGFFSSVGESMAGVIDSVVQWREETIFE
ncbi:MAG: hypothetical protein WDZ88_00870 [Candidatus Paceibacterota bacterium]